MRTAFKEWAVIVDALAQGRQTLILRKGGIAEGQGGFRAEHPRFLFFPTLFHQQREAVVPAAQARFDQIQPLLPDASQVRITHWAAMETAVQLPSLAHAKALAGLHAWTEATIASRFDWGREEGIWALILRVWQLPPTAAADLPVLPEYGGCKSWIELAADIETAGSTPALTDQAWQAQLEEIGRRLARF